MKGWGGWVSSRCVFGYVVSPYYNWLWKRKKKVIVGSIEEVGWHAGGGGGGGGRGGGDKVISRVLCNY